MPWERCFGRATDGIRQERYISVNFKRVVSYGACSQRHIKNYRTTPCFLLAYKVERYLHQFLLQKLTHYEGNRSTCLTKETIFLSAVLYSTACKFTLSMPCLIPAYEVLSGNCAWFILIWRWCCRHSC